MCQKLLASNTELLVCNRLDYGVGTVESFVNFYQELTK